MLIARDQSLLGARFPVEARQEGQAVSRLDFQGQPRIASILANKETGYFVVSLLAPGEITEPAVRLILLLLAIIVVVCIPLAM